MRHWMAGGLLILFLLSSSIAGEIYTPKKGSAERTALADAMRAYVFQQYGVRDLRQPVLWVINHLKVTGNYAAFGGNPVYKDGSYVEAEVLPDIDYMVCLKKLQGTWTVVYDLSRSDVPDAAEMKRIANRFPDDFPLEILDPFWQETMEGSR